MKEKIKFDSYRHYSEQAAKAEREGRYSDAVKLWSDAQRVSTNNANEQWCQNRLDFCERMVKRPFKGE